MGAILKELHNSASKFQFPSMPKDDVDVKRETAYQEYNILGKGKMSYPSGMGTQIIKWSVCMQKKDCLRKRGMDSTKNLRQQAEKLADKKDTVKSGGF